CAARTSLLVGRAEHEVVDKQLRAPVEQFDQRLLPVLGLEDVPLVDADPGQLLSLLRDLLVELPELPLALVNRLDRSLPLVPRNNGMISHLSSLTGDGPLDDCSAKNSSPRMPA